MNLGRWLTGSILAGAGLLVYGSLVEAKRLRLERVSLHLPNWPSHLDGYRIGLMADMHLRDWETVNLTQRAVNALLREQPDMIAIAGDFVGHWKDTAEEWLQRGLSGLELFERPIFAVPGNHDYWPDDPARLLPILEEKGIRLLRNESVSQDGITWVGIDSANEGQADMLKAFSEADLNQPQVVMWHEPDMADALPAGPSLMLAGHSHGGQFTLPWGTPFMTTRNGSKYVRGFYSEPDVPVYVSRGLATTGPPSRLFCPPEVTVLTLNTSR